MAVSQVESLRVNGLRKAKNGENDVLRRKSRRLDHGRSSGYSTPSGSPSRSAEAVHKAKIIDDESDSNENVFPVGSAKESEEEKLIEKPLGRRIENSFDKGFGNTFKIPLGMLNENMLKYLDNKKMSYPDFFSHDDLNHHIQRYMEEKFMQLPTQGCFRSRSELVEMLTQIVFNNDDAKEVVSQIPEEILFSQEASYWALRHLQDCQMGDQDGPYLYRTDCLDDWFEQDLPSPCRGSDKMRNTKKRIKMYNEKDKQVKKEDIETDEGFSYHYHGTNKANAENILNNGILLGKGMAKKDFSDGDGFYVSQDIDLARNWAKRGARKRGEQGARKWADQGNNYAVVFVFRTPDNFFSDETKHIHLSDDSTTVDVMRYFRSGCKPSNAIYEFNNPSMEDCHSITGPILIRVESLKNPNPDLKGKQTCIRHKECAKEFYSYVYKIFFFENHDEK